MGAKPLKYKIVGFNYLHVINDVSHVYAQKRPLQVEKIIKSRASIFSSVSPISEFTTELPHAIKIGQ